MIRRLLQLIVIGLVVYVAWLSFSPSAHESAVLHTTGTGSKDHFATIWFVDDGHFVWIRAEANAPPWLPQLRANTQVELRRGGINHRYRATLFDNSDSRSYVSPLFRAKYGVSELARELFRGSDVIPIRLEPL